jgi:hypothetical protein
MDQAGEATPNKASIKSAVTRILEMLEIGSSGFTQLYAHLICRFAITVLAVGLWFYVPYMIEMEPDLYWWTKLIIASPNNNTYYQQIGVLERVSFKNCV